MMKVGPKQRRTKAEVEQQKQENFQREEEIKTKMARLDQVEAELKVMEEAAQSNKGAAILMSQMINAGVVKQDDESTIFVQKDG